MKFLPLLLASVLVASAQDYQCRPTPAPTPRSSAWTFAATTPSGGNNGDKWCRTDTGQIFQKEGDAWALVMVLPASLDPSSFATAAQGTDARVPMDGSVTDSKVANGAAIALAKLATNPLSRVNHTGTQSASTITGLSQVATSGAYGDLAGRPVLGTAAGANISDFASAAQGALAATAVQPNQVATTSSSGVVRQAAALTMGSASAITNNTGGSAIISGIIPVITGAVYATDAAGIKNAIATLITGQNTTRSRLEELIANLQASGALKP